MAEALFDQIPVVDLGPLSEPSASLEARQELAEELCRICHEVGFFLVVNHGVSDGLCDDVFEMMHRFFALPTTRKR